MTDCADCKVKNRQLVLLADRCKDLSEEHKREMKRSTELSNTLQTIYRIAKDKMWYPSTFEERGESGHPHQDVFVAADIAAMKTPVETPR